MSFKIAYLETKKWFVWQRVNCRGTNFNFKPIYLQAEFRDVSLVLRHEVDVLSDLFQLWVGFCCLKVSVWLNWNYPGKRKCLAHTGVCAWLPWNRLNSLSKFAGLNQSEFSFQRTVTLTFSWSSGPPCTRPARLSAQSVNVGGYSVQIVNKTWNSFYGYITKCSYRNFSKTRSSGLFFVKCQRLYWHL